MTSIETVGALILKILKLNRYGGGFLKVGGTWNLNEEKNPDAEIVASGVFVGYFIYTCVSIISLCFATADHKNTFTDILMNIIGVFLWVAVGATALHYWSGYLVEHKYLTSASEREVGLAMGSLCILSGAAYLVDTVLAIIFVIKAKM
ncbi:hypothetical protein Zmor_023570 [Zophobas morio]|uniref:Protein snakeskin n=1 Tax=Zophobas morio TaxID=2755281 RepID=A0AA38M7F3_9CUCU|nr:hypothetical protein Zmor_023570 [Zophobas morio]